MFEGKREEDGTRLAFKSSIGGFDTEEGMGAGCWQTKEVSRSPGVTLIDQKRKWGRGIRRVGTRR